MPSNTQPELPPGAPADLLHAGAAVDKAVEYMVSQNIGEKSIASALLGGALALMCKHMPDEAVVKVLNNAISGVRAGQMRTKAG